MYFFPYFKSFSLIVYLFIHSNTNAQKIHKVDCKIIGLKQGLTSANVRKIIKDKNGFFWFATQDGLNKFDGLKITQFTKDNKNNARKILGADCFTMEYDSILSHIYVSNSYDGLNVIDINTNTIVSKIKSKDLFETGEAQWLKSICNFKEYLVLCSDDRISIFNKMENKVKVVKFIEDAKNNSIQKIFLFENKIGVLFLNGTITFLNEDLTFSHKLDFKITEKELNVLSFEVFNDNLFLATNKGLKVFNLKENNNTLNVDLLAKLPSIYKGAFTHSVNIINSKLYFSNALGAYSFDLLFNKFHKIILNIENDFDFLNSANAFFNDGDFIWVAAVSGVAKIKLKHSSYSAFYKDVSSISKLENCFPIRAINNYAYVGAEDALYKVNLIDNSFKKLLKKQFAYSFLPISASRILVSSTNKLLVLENDKVLEAGKLYKELLPLERDLFVVMEKISANKILLASQLGTGLYLWDNLNHSVNKYDKSTNTKLSDLLINAIIPISSNQALIVEENAIELFDFNENTIITKFDKSKMGNYKTDVFMDLCIGNDGYWIAGYGLGIIKLNSAFEMEYVIGINEGLNNAGVYKIFNTGDTLISVTTNNGFSIYNTKTKKVSNYFKEDGLHSSIFNELSGCKIGDSILAGGFKGFTIFDPSKYKTNRVAPKLYFNEINILAGKNSIDTTNLFLTHLTIPNNYTQVKINFIGINYQNPDRVNYWYRIKERSNEWIDHKTQNFIDFIGFAPGNYTLEVKAANEDGVECEPIVLKLRFLPKWYQTWWFYFLVALAIGSILFVLYKFRIRQLKKVLAVRQKISSDLHDDIGSTLSTINMYTQIATLKPNDPAYIANIQENTKDALDKLDDIVWATNPKNDMLFNITERMEMFAKPILNAKNIAFTFNKPTNLNELKISESTRQNLYLIFKEAVNNIAKYSEAKQCDVLLEIKSKQLQLTITDDGKGFDTNAPTQRNGLVNMALRARQLNGKYELKSEIGKGTIIKLSMQLA